MEKQPLKYVPDQGASQAGPRALRNRLSKAIIILVLCLVATSLVPRNGTWFPFDYQPSSTNGDNSSKQSAKAASQSPAKDSYEQKDPTFNWDTVKTLPYLAYSPCYPEIEGGFQCARLELPMDYWNGTTNATISLAVIKKPAVVPVTDERYGGAILLNPGGPGGSGVGFLVGSAKHIRETVDSPLHQKDGTYYDLVSFEPRGVGQSQPAVNCLNSWQLEQSWQVRVMEEGVFESSDASLGRLWSMSIARGKSCSLPQPDGSEADIRKFVSTASVARDMLEIVERHGEWREKEAVRLQTQSAPVTKAAPWMESETITDALRRLRHKPGEEKIQYWGFSYGTYLGNTFATLFPDRVHRIVVDGVVDAYNYKQTLWSDNLIDTEKDMNLFYYHCARAGWPACALANETGETTAEGVSQRVASITQSLYHNPLPVISPRPEVIAYSDIKNLIFGGLYSPIQSFPFIANLLSDVERGNGTAFASLLKSYHSFSCPPQPGAGFSIIPLNNRTLMSYDATMAIACSDGDDQSWVDKSTFTQYAKELAQLSPSIGSMWSTIRMHCVHYSVRALYRFEGPWTAKTSHPLLMIGNTADPVTPGRFAHKMAEGFEGAVALMQNSGGHCSSSASSNCTMGYVRRYFHTGELPPVNTTCAVDEVPFGPGASAMEARDSVELLAAKQRSRGIHAALHKAGGAFMRLGFPGRMRDGWLE